MNAATLLALGGLAVVLFFVAESARASARDALAIATGDPLENEAASDAGFTLPPVAAWAADAFGNPQRMSEAGLRVLMTREGFAAEPYPDFKGFSIGYGHLIRPGENLERVTMAQAAQLLADDVSWAEAAVRAAITVPLTAAQFDALVSFAFNVGAGAFKRSTLARKINAYDATASAEFSRWVYAGGEVNPGLVARRESESQQFEATA